MSSFISDEVQVRVVREAIYMLLNARKLFLILTPPLTIIITLLAIAYYVHHQQQQEQLARLEQQHQLAVAGAAGPAIRVRTKMPLSSQNNTNIVEKLATTTNKTATMSNLQHLPHKLQMAEAAVTHLNLLDALMNSTMHEGPSSVGQQRAKKRHWRQEPAAGSVGGLSAPAVQQVGVIGGGGGELRDGNLVNLLANRTVEESQAVNEEKKAQVGGGSDQFREHPQATNATKTIISSVLKINHQNPSSQQQINASIHHSTTTTTVPPQPPPVVESSSQIMMMNASTISAPTNTTHTPNRQQQQPSNKSQHQQNSPLQKSRSKQQVIVADGHPQKKGQHYETLDIVLDRDNFVLHNRCSMNRLSVRINKRSKRAQVSCKQQKMAAGLMRQPDSAKIKLLSMVITVEGVTPSTQNSEWAGGGASGGEHGIVAATTSAKYKLNEVKLRANLTELYICFDKFGNIEAQEEVPQTKLLASLILFLITLLCGYLPVKILLNQRYIQHAMFAGGGVLMATAFCHLIPEAHDSYKSFLLNASATATTDQHNEHSNHLHEHDGAGQNGSNPEESLLSSDSSPEPISTLIAQIATNSSQNNNNQTNLNNSQIINIDNPHSHGSHLHGHSHGGEGVNLPYIEITLCCGFFFMYLVEQLMVRFINNHSHEHPCDTNSIPNGGSQVLVVGIGAGDSQSNGIGSTAGTSVGNLSTSVMHVSSSSRGASELYKFIRGLLIVSAFGAHSIFDGVAIGSQESVEKVWTIFVAISCHKLIIAAVVGLELYAATLESHLWTLVHLIIFSIMSPIGIILVVVAQNTLDLNSNHPAMILLQSFATGTLLYIIFVEILQPKEDQVYEKHKLGKSFSLIAGFGFMLTVLTLIDH